MTERGSRLGEGKEAEVFEYGTDVLKLYRNRAAKAPAFREAAILAFVETTGIAAPEVRSVGQFGDAWGLVMARAEGEAFAEAMTREPGRAGGFSEAMVALQLGIHQHQAMPLPQLKARLSRNIARAEELRDGIRQRLIGALAALPEGDRLCHGDFHPWNIIGSVEGAVVVDWLDACRGAPAADVCRSYVLMHAVIPEFADAYVLAYSRAANVEPGTIFAWLPVVAAARLAEGVPNEVEQLVRWAETV
jgi:aminoglycoside phosphotransferase (APT) family kinase protein